jgi:nucleoside 2-deoxyribosyltransferase
MAKKTIVICTSAAFYEHANEIAVELEKNGFNVVVPATAIRMQEENNYSVERIKTWYDKPEDVRIKQGLARKHFEEVEKGDAILIVNDDKPGKPTYIGPNTIMEWGLAYYLNKPIFLLNSVGKDQNTYEEALGMTTTILDGDLSKIKL